MARFHLPDNLSNPAKLQLAKHIEENYPDQVREKPVDKEEGSQYCLNTSLYSFMNVPDNRQEIFVNQVVHWTERNQPTLLPAAAKILDELSEEDILHLCETEDEASQSQGYLTFVYHHAQS